MILSYNTFTDLKSMAVKKQYWELAAFVRDIERKITREVNIGEVIPNNYFQDLHKLLINYNNRSYIIIYKKWFRKLKIKNLYENT